ncbi:unnamed protein product [Boreogadus saida]
MNEGDGWIYWTPGDGCLKCTACDEYVTPTLRSWTALGVKAALHLGKGHRMASVTSIRSWTACEGGPLLCVSIRLSRVTSIRSGKPGGEGCTPHLVADRLASVDQHKSSAKLGVKACKYSWCTTDGVSEQNTELDSPGGEGAGTALGVTASRNEEGRREGKTPHEEHEGKSNGPQYNRRNYTKGHPPSPENLTSRPPYPPEKLPSKYRDTSRNED